jgi:hypothetical protein
LQLVQSATLAWAQPVDRLQVSVVQSLPSLQFTGVVEHWPVVPSQVAVLQALLPVHLAE